MKVHPDADIFPMMPDDELAALAEDIKVNGLIHPLVTGDYQGEEVLVDGRNRKRACEIAGVEPMYRKLNGEDQKAYILSVNVNRRHLTIGQRAMAIAMVYPDAARVRRKGVGPRLEQGPNSVSLTMLSRARNVLANAPDLAKAVLTGDMGLPEAFIGLSEREGTIRNKQIRLRRLREQWPDLADRVVQEEITIDTAETQAKAEVEARKQQRWAATTNLIDGVKLLDRDAETASEIAADFDPSIAEQRGEAFTPARLRRAAAFLTALADIMENSNANA